MKKKRLRHRAFDNNLTQRRIAFHEAGHAVADVLLGLSFDFISIIPKPFFLQAFQNGRKVNIKKVCPEGISLSPEREEKNKMEIEAGKLDLREAISTMAGPQAEAMFIGEIDKETNEAALLDMNTIVMCCRVAAAPGISIEQVPTRIMESTIVNALSA